MNNAKQKLPIYLIHITVIVLILATQLAAQTSIQEYAMGPGDKLNIQVWEHPDLESNVTISGSGDFNFPLVGQVNAGGLSVLDLEKKLEKKLAGTYIVSPQVRVSVMEYKNQKAYLFGAIRQPGSYVIMAKTTILELISSIGGITDNTGSTVIIVRPQSKERKNRPLSIDEAQPKEIIRVDLERLNAGEVGENVFVMPGDSIYVKKAQKIFVTGEVNKPGRFKWEKFLTVRKAISLAGGPSTAGSSKRAQIIRTTNGREIKIKPKMSDAVKPEDIIKVPRSYF